MKKPKSTVRARRAGDDASEQTPPIDPNDPRLDAFVEAVACALIEDLANSGRV